MLQSEFNKMIKILGEDVFKKEIYNEEFDKVLHTPTLNYDNLHYPIKNK